jgi:hypothetical protein
MLPLVLATCLFIGEREVQIEKPAPGSDKPHLQLPAQVQAQPMLPFKVVAETNLKWMRWTIPAGLTRVDPKDTAYGDKAFVGYGPAGVYEFKIEGTVNDQFVEAKCIAFIGQPSPHGPDGPPKPPTPVDDPLFAELQRLYSADPNPQKALHRDRLIIAYEVAVEKALKDQTLTTTQELFAKVREVSAGMVEGNLQTVREKLRETCAEFATENKPLTPASRDKAAECFRRAAKLLRGLQ